MIKNATFAPVAHQRGSESIGDFEMSLLPLPSAYSPSMGRTRFSQSILSMPPLPALVDALRRCQPPSAL